MKIKSSVIIVPLFVSSLFLAACDNQDQAKRPESKVTAQDVKEESKEALNMPVAHIEQRKDAYQQQIEAELKSYDQKLNKLKDEAMGLKDDDAKAEYNQQIVVLEQKIKSASEKFNALKSASDETWDEVKPEMDKAVDELRDTYDKVSTNLKKS